MKKTAVALETELGAIGGAPAQEALQALVAQFSQRSAFVRELIQNSLDADAGRIDLEVREEGQHLVLSVSDDGAGMDREIIETALLVLFRSSKEGDLTRIGKFGIGFVSIFAVNPEVVLVDTSRDGVHHRVVFDQDRRYTLAVVDEPFDGTRVAIHVPIRGEEARILAQEVREAASYWCGFARADIRVSGRGRGWEWPETRFAREWAVDSPIQVHVEEDGFRAVLGFTREEEPLVGYYNLGLTLLETREVVVRGVTFRVESRLLAHTVTRDNVIRDRNWERVVQRLRDLADRKLRPAWLEALREAAAREDASRLEHLLSVAGPPYAEVPSDLACLPRYGGGVVSLAALKKGFLPRSHQVLYATRPCPLADVVAARDLVLLDPEGGPRFQDLVPSLGRFQAVDVEDAFFRPVLVDAHPLVDAARPLATCPVLGARFADGGRAISGRLALFQARPGELERVPVSRTSGSLVINVEHPSLEAFQALPPPVGAALLLASSLREAGERGELPAPLLQVLRSWGGA